MFIIYKVVRNKSEPTIKRQDDSKYKLADIRFILYFPSVSAKFVSRW